MASEIVIKRGDIFYTNLGKRNGSVQGGKRPVVILQNDVGNKFSPTVIVAPVTSALKTSLPTHVKVKNDFLEEESIILTEQIRTLNKYELKKKIGTLNFREVRALDRALSISIALVS